ncbi:hypothetical protein M378DRAFT_165884 [Amanita muscaria Koide BX008]|uniref:Uncharacterized protein n=1 Tax=Amanita muscaria (strain Koide BX008) TaxID=946122 RepID=A0A0C2WL98_AMAMK|nr:hypothetical protein M378DRAFT_165884 [Amanita muscaria Koide BX008]
MYRYYCVETLRPSPQARRAPIVMEAANRPRRARHLLTPSSSISTEVATKQPEGIQTSTERT